MSGWHRSVHSPPPLPPMYTTHTNLMCTYYLPIFTLGLVYYMLGNLHPKFRSFLKSIQLLCVARNSIVVEYGIEILKPIVESVQKLEKVKQYLHLYNL